MRSGELILDDKEENVSREENPVWVLWSEFEIYCDRYDGFLYFTWVQMIEYGLSQLEHV